MDLGKISRCNQRCFGAVPVEFDSIENRRTKTSAGRYAPPRFENIAEVGYLRPATQDTASQRVDLRQRSCTTKRAHSASSGSKNLKGLLARLVK